MKPQVQATVATLYQRAQEPLTLLDNVEKRNLDQRLQDFLLYAATGGSRAKCDAENRPIDQNINTVVLFNGVESCGVPEVDDRTLEFACSKTHHHEFVSPGVALDELLEARSEILTAVAHVLADDVLPRLRAGFAGEVRAFRERAKRFPRTRLNEYLALAWAVCHAIMVRLGQDPDAVLDRWLALQTIRITETESTDTPVLNSMDSLIRVPVAVIRDVVKGYSRIEGRAVFSATAMQLLVAIRAAAKHLGLTCPFSSAKQLMARYSASQAVLAHAGWGREVEKTVKGTTVWAFEREGPDVHAAIDDEDLGDGLNLR